MTAPPPTARSIAASATGYGYGYGYGYDANDPRNGVPLVFVSDILGNTVNIYDFQGRPTGQLSGFQAPTGIAVAANRDLYVADSSNRVIKIYKAGYTQPPSRIETPGQHLADLKISATGLIAVVEVSVNGGTPNGLNSVSFYPTGSDQPCKTLSSPDLTYMNFGAFDANGVFYVDGYSSSIVPSVGRIVGGCSATSIAVQPLPNPMGQLAGVAVNSQGQVLIGDAVGVTIYTYNVMKSGKLALDKYTIFSNNEVIWSFVLRPTNDKAASEDTVFVANTRIQGTGSGWDEYAYPAAQSPIVSVAGLHEAVGIAITPAHNALETW